MVRDINLLTSVIVHTSSIVFTLWKIQKSQHLNKERVRTLNLYLYSENFCFSAAEQLSKFSRSFYHFACTSLFIAYRVVPWTILWVTPSLTSQWVKFKARGPDPTCLPLNLSTRGQRWNSFKRPVTDWVFITSHVAWKTECTYNFNQKYNLHESCRPEQCQRRGRWNNFLLTGLIDH